MVSESLGIQSPAGPIRGKKTTLICGCAKELVLSLIDIYLLIQEIFAPLCLIPGECQDKDVKCKHKRR